MCTSLTHPGCDTDPNANNIKTDECTLNHMADMQRIVQQHSDLSNISHIFDVDTAHIYSATPPMACAKMVLKGKLYYYYYYIKYSMIEKNVERSKRNNLLSFVVCQ